MMRAIRAPILALVLIPGLDCAHRNAPLTRFGKEHKFVVFDPDAHQLYFHRRELARVIASLKV